MTSIESLSLRALYSRALSNISEAWDLPTSDDEGQNHFLSALADLQEVVSRVSVLSLFNQNDVLEDIPSADLLYLTVSFVLAEVEDRFKVAHQSERMTNLISAQTHMQTFISTLELYGIPTEMDHIIHKQRLSSLRDPTERRETKIKRYKAEQDLRIRIDTLHQRRKCPDGSHLPNNFDLILSMLSSASVDATTTNKDNSEVDDFFRETSLLLLRLLYARASSQIEGFSQELELLQNSSLPPLPQPSEEHRGRAKEDEMWRLDTTLVSRDKSFQPFVLLPSNRESLQKQVFGPSHRLPTMTIDEYLEIERERGTVITGGGHQSKEKPTSSEQLILDSDMDGTMFGELKLEEKRRKDEQWAQFKDANPKGIGNTLNRG